MQHILSLPHVLSMLDARDYLSLLSCNSALLNVSRSPITLPLLGAALKRTLNAPASPADAGDAPVDAVAESWQQRKAQLLRPSTDAWRRKTLRVQTPALALDGWLHSFDSRHGDIWAITADGNVHYQKFDPDRTRAAESEAPTQMTRRSRRHAQAEARLEAGRCLYQTGLANGFIRALGQGRAAVWASNGLNILKLDDDDQRLQLVRSGIPSEAEYLATQEFGDVRGMCVFTHSTMLLLQKEAVLLMDDQLQLVLRKTIAPSLLAIVPGTGGSFFTFQRGRSSTATLWDWRSAIVASRNLPVAHTYPVCARVLDTRPLCLVSFSKHNDICVYDMRYWREPVCSLSSSRGSWFDAKNGVIAELSLAPSPSGASAAGFRWHTIDQDVWSHSVLDAAPVGSVRVQDHLYEADDYDQRVVLDAARGVAFYAHDMHQIHAVHI